MTYGLIGEKLGHSYSKVIHNLLGNQAYTLKEIAPENLPAFMETSGFQGINVTIPYKERVMPYCTLSPEAQRIGCVNTIVHKDGQLFGHNTDYAGFLYMLRRGGIALKGKKVVILGSGGTSKTAACVAADEGAGEVIKVSRQGAHNYDNVANHADAQILINTTPVGMYPRNLDAPVSLESFPCLEGVVDVIYNPLKTALTLAAAERGIPHTNGLSMLVAQAAYAHGLFFGVDVDEATMEQILTEVQKQMRNVVLVGMPGCGKTTFGQMLAQTLGLAFVDTDECIQVQTGHSPSEFITTHGEAHFREIEKEVVAQVAKQTGQVIATGGGSVLLPENRMAMKQNGFVVFLDRPLELLATEGRPLSTNLNALYSTRYPIYTQMCDVCIQVEGNVREVFEHIIAAL